MSNQSHSDQEPFGAHAPNAMQRLVIAAAHGSGLKRGAFRPWLSRLVHLLGAGPIDATYQGASFRLHHLASGTERGALFNPDYNLPELDFSASTLRKERLSLMSAPTSAPMPSRSQSTSEPQAASLQSNHIPSVTRGSHLMQRLRL